MAKKLPTLDVFMTSKDEEDFSALLKSQLPDIIFIDQYPWLTPQPPLCNSIAECCSRPNSAALLINTLIMSIDNYRETQVAKMAEREEYHGTPVGPGIIQFRHSKRSGYIPDGLRNGRLAASYDPKLDPLTDAFVKAVWTVCKRHAIRLFSFDPKTGLTSEEPDSYSIFAWPDAVAQYDRVEGMCLSANAMSFFTAVK